ncbi:OmpH family outer membrane protein [Candidatus Nesciobacter abundans]|uniref:OmpH family outer membrane protein n=1 Tax=Candidatus Nesciobacter abundans TaxID=2601668 RepID=A0A5C0UGC0_9PROT|nr:OmpH family outer membrane protein [Candidatus Nesciobacter abundans]QEK38859.1 OmpH family outer membrane protein [Candidatus Nesciobacter abundans]
MFTSRILSVFLMALCMLGFEMNAEADKAKFAFIDTVQIASKSNKIKNKIEKTNEMKKSIEKEFKGKLKTLQDEMEKYNSFKKSDPSKAEVLAKSIEKKRQALAEEYSKAQETFKKQQYADLTEITKSIENASAAISKKHGVVIIDSSVILSGKGLLKDLTEETSKLIG